MFEKLFGWLSGLVPKEWKADVAIRKVSLFAAAFVVTYATGKIAAGHVSPEDAATVQLGISTALAAALRALIDWAHVKYPDIKWLAI